jgi:hypothetical protein
MDRLLAGAVGTLPRVALVMEISIDYAYKPDKFAVLGACCVNLFYCSASSLAPSLKHFTAEGAEIAEIKH